MGSTMGMPVRLADLSPVEVSPQEIVAHLERAGQTALGEQSDITPKDVIEILRLAA
jgi:NADP-dependent alcohol dehydrogenase